jgi:hypothetical protein
LLLSRPSVSRFSRDGPGAGARARAPLSSHIVAVQVQVMEVVRG